MKTDHADNPNCWQVARQAGQERSAPSILQTHVIHPSGATDLSYVLFETLPAFYQQKPHL